MNLIKIFKNQKFYFHIELWKFKVFFQVYNLYEYISYIYSHFENLVFQELFQIIEKLQKLYRILKISK